MKVITAQFCQTTKYEYDENDPVFGDASNEDLEKLFKTVLFTDLFQTTNEEDILPLIKIEILD